MRFEAGAPQRRTPGWPLAVALGVHLLLGWWWLHTTSVRVLTSDVAALREFFVVVVPQQRPQQQRAAAPSRPAAAPAPMPRASAAPARPVTPAAPQAITVPAPPSPAPAAQPPPAAAASDVDAGLPAAPPTAGDLSGDDGSVAGRARRQAGTADHALREGKVAPLDATGSKWSRFSTAVASARVDTSKTLITETYTSPDGTVVYRFRQGGRTWCRTGGSVGPSMFGAVGGGQVLFDKAGGGGSAGTINCPKGAEFKRD